MDIIGSLDDARALRAVPAGSRPSPRCGRTQTPPLPISRRDHCTVTAMPADRRRSSSEKHPPQAAGTSRALRPGSRSRSGCRTRTGRRRARFRRQGELLGDRDRPMLEQLGEDVLDGHDLGAAPVRLVDRCSVHNLDRRSKREHRLRDDVVCERTARCVTILKVNPSWPASVTARHLATMCLTFMK